jgi:hypothetical protein
MNNCFNIFLILVVWRVVIQLLEVFKLGFETKFRGWGHFPCMEHRQNFGLLRKWQIMKNCFNTILILVVWRVVIQLLEVFKLGFETKFPGWGHFPCVEHRRNFGLLRKWQMMNNCFKLFLLLVVWRVVIQLLEVFKLGFETNFRGWGHFPCVEHRRFFWLLRKWQMMNNCFNIFLILVVWRVVIQLLEVFKLGSKKHVWGAFWNIV